MGQVSLHVDGGLKPSYKSGDAISGRVRYHLTKQEKVEAVVVIIKGKSYSRIDTHSNNSRQQHKEAIDLFRLTETLYAGNYTIQAQTLEWPFSFQIPDQTRHIRGDGRGDTTYENEPHDLPPTFAVSGRNCLASISYKLKATVNPASLFHSKTQETAFRLIPMCAPATIRSLTTTGFRPLGISRWSSNTLRPVPHTFKQKLAHIFTSDPTLATPVINISAALQIPDSASPTTPMPITLAVTHVLEGTNDPPNPSLILTRVLLELKAYTNIRVSGLLRGYYKSTSDGVGVASFTFAAPSRTGIIANIRDAPPPHYTDNTNNQELTPTYEPSSSPSANQPSLIPLDATPITLHNGFRLSDMRQDGCGIVPDFRSYTMQHSHALRVTVEIRHLDTGHVFKIEGPKVPFRVLGREMTEAERDVHVRARTAVADSGWGSVEAAMYGGGESDEVLAGPSEGPPAYDNGASKGKEADGNVKAVR